MGLPTPEEAWNELLLELKAASQELYVAFVSLSASPKGNEPAAPMPETQRYDEALRRFDAARAKIRALGANGLDRCVAVVGRAEDLDVRLVGEKIGNPLAREQLVVDDQDADWRVRHVARQAMEATADVRRSARV